MAMFFDDLFGSLFDLDGDGKTDLFEEALVFTMLDELEKEEHDSLFSDSDMDDSDDPDDF